MSRSLAHARATILALETPTELSAILRDPSQETALRLLAGQLLSHHGADGRRLLQAAFDVSEQDPAGRVAALQPLVSNFPRHAEPTLAEALGDYWPRVRRCARLLLLKHQDQFAPDFRLRCYLPLALHDPESIHKGDYSSLTPHECRVLWQALGQARYSPALPPLIAALKNYSSAQSWDLSFTRTHLESAIAAFENEAVPLLVATIPDTYPVNQAYLLQTLAAIPTPEARAALANLSLPHNPRALERMQEWHRRRARLRNTRGQQRKTYLADQMGVRPTPPAEIAKEMGRLEANAHDTNLPYNVRQRAHNDLERWRRYNAPGKR